MKKSRSRREQKRCALRPPSLIEQTMIRGRSVWYCNIGQPYVYTRRNHLLYLFLFALPLTSPQTLGRPCVDNRTMQDLSFGGYHRDDLGKVIIADDGLNGVELGPSIETKTGWKPADRLATYTRGSGTDTLSFLYTVREVRMATWGTVMERC